MSYTTLKLEYDGLLATITLDRPDKRNAISSQMIDDLLAALDDVEKSAARVLIITGSGKAFCAGMDLDELRAIAGQSPLDNLKDSRQMAKMFQRI
jgi:methylglutaconyl-CoA hydratase